MGNKDSEGSWVLEKLAEIGQHEAFLEAVDSDDFGRAAALLGKAGVEEPILQRVLRQMAEGE